MLILLMEGGKSVGRNLQWAASLVVTRSHFCEMISSAILRWILSGNRVIELEMSSDSLAHLSRVPLRVPEEVWKPTKITAQRT
jgi:hypothetical protein